MLQFPRFVHQTGHLVLPAGGAAARAELGLTDNYYDTSAGQRERMLKTTEKLDKTTDRIQQGRAQLAETEVMPLVVQAGQYTHCSFVCASNHTSSLASWHVNMPCTFHDVACLVTCGTQCVHVAMNGMGVQCCSIQCVMIRLRYYQISHARIDGCSIVLVTLFSGAAVLLHASIVKVACRLRQPAFCKNSKHSGKGLVMHRALSTQLTST